MDVARRTDTHIVSRALSERMPSSDRDLLLTELTERLSPLAAAPPGAGIDASQVTDAIVRAITPVFAERIEALLPGRPLAPAVVDELRRVLDLKPGTPISVVSLLSASRSGDERHTRQPWDAMGNVTLRIGRAPATVDFRVILLARPGTPASLIMAGRDRLTATDVEHLRGHSRGERFEGLLGRTESEATVRSIADDVLRRLGRSARPETFIEHPSLRHLGAVAPIMDTLELTPGTFSLRTASDRREAAVWVTRNLHELGERVTRESVLAELRTIDSNRRAVRSEILFEGRTILASADGETLRNRPGGHSMESMRLALGHIGALSAFGTPETMSRLREAAGPTGSARLIQRTGSIEEQLGDLLTIYADILPNLTRPPKGIAEEADHSTFRCICRNILGIDPDLLHVNVTMNSRGSRGTLYVSGERGERLLYAAFERDGDGFKVTGVELPGRDEVRPRAPVTAREAKEQVLRGIAETPPGPNGFMFVGMQHGNVDSLSIDAQRLRADHGVVSREYLSAREIADALKARTARFGNHSIVMFHTSCFGADFCERVAAELKDTDVRPIFWSSSEKGQLSIGEGANHIPNSDLRAALYRATEARSKRTGAPTIGTLLELDRDPNLQSPPVLLAPDRRPRKEGGRNRPFLQISGQEPRMTDSAA